MRPKLTARSHCLHSADRPDRRSKRCSCDRTQAENPFVSSRILRTRLRRSRRDPSVAEVSLLAWGAAAAVPDGELLGRAGALVVHVPGGAPRMVRGGSLLTFRRDAHRGDLVVALDPLIWDPEEL